jgi:deoxyhypusine synthase
MDELAELVFKARETGAIILGGGVSKHYILGANTLRDGLDYGIQITTDREEGGSLSGARLEEAVSWRKAKGRRNLVTVYGDATLVFPVLWAGVRRKVYRLRGKG